jgi:hypothetical protein
MRRFMEKIELINRHLAHQPTADWAEGNENEMNKIPRRPPDRGQ